MPIIKEHIEILPLIFDGGEYSAINVTTVLNATDYEKSDFLTFSNSNRILEFHKHCLREEIVKGVPIFKIVDEPVSWVFISDEFRNAVDANHLLGFEFQFVWDSEEMEITKQGRF